MTALSRAPRERGLGRVPRVLPGLALCGVVAMAAIGARTTLGGITAAGWRPAVVLAAATVILALGAVGVLPIAEVLFPIHISPA